MEIITFNELDELISNTDSVLFLYPDWRFMQKEFSATFAFNKESLVSEKYILYKEDVHIEDPFGDDQITEGENGGWLGIFDFKGSHIRCYDLINYPTPLFFFSAQNSSFLSCALHDYFSRPNLVYSEFSQMLYELIGSIDCRIYDWIAIYDNNEFDRPVILFDSKKSFDRSLMFDRLNGVR